MMFPTDKNYTRGTFIRILNECNALQNLAQRYLNLISRSREDSRFLEENLDLKIKQLQFIVNTLEDSEAQIKSIVNETLNLLDIKEIENEELLS